MARIKQIANAGPQVEMHWECEIDKDIKPLHSELESELLVSTDL
jgi:G:T-mismatch repair DNA endonuclease (very short patch repair protein)